MADAGTEANLMGRHVRLRARDNAGWLTYPTPECELGSGRLVVYGRDEGRVVRHDPLLPAWWIVEIRTGGAVGFVPARASQLEVL